MLTVDVKIKKSILANITFTVDVLSENAIFFFWMGFVLKSENNLGDCNGSLTHNHLVPWQTFNHLAKPGSLAKWLSVCLLTGRLWIWGQLQSPKFQILCLFRARSWHSGNWSVQIHSKRFCVLIKSHSPKIMLNFINTCF